MEAASECQIGYGMARIFRAFLFLDQCSHAAALVHLGYALATRRVLSPSITSFFLHPRNTATTMAKRRSNAIESDGEAEQQETQAGSSKRARFNEQANERITYAPAPDGESSKSKKKRAKKGGDADEMNEEEAEPVTLDDLHESQQAEDDLTTTDRFEQEHEEAIRQSIRNRENLSGVCISIGS